MAFNEIVLLNAVTGTGAGTNTVDATQAKNFTFTIEASTVTTGATVVIETLVASGTWIVISTTAVVANGNTVVTLANAAHKTLRANVSAYTDGTYTVCCASSD